MNDEESAYQGIQTSLKKLDLEYIDLYLLHQALNDYFSAYRALERAYKEGILKAIGVSNFYPNILTNLCEIVDIIPAVNQVELHPYFIQNEALETMAYYGVVAEAWAPLGGGRYDPYNNKMLIKIAEKYNKTVAQVLLRWGIQRKTVVLPKSVHKERIKENFEVFDFTLTEEEMAMIASLDMGYGDSRTKHFDPDFVRMCLNQEFDVKKGLVYGK